MTTDAVHQVTGALDAATTEQVRSIARDAHEHDGIEALGEQSLLNLADDAAAATHLVLRADGGVHGYAQVDLSAGVEGPASAELVVAPAHRRQGFGARLLTAVRDVRGPGCPPAVWAHGDLPGAQALAARADLQVHRELWQMSLDLTTDDRTRADHAGLPEGVVVRPFEVGRDEQRWLEVNTRAFADHPEQGRMTLEDLRARQREPWFDPGDLLLAERDGRLLAFTWLKVEPGSDVGELYVLGVDPQAQGTGLGRALTARTVDELRAKGLRHAILYTEATNTAAVRTYQAAGFITSRTDVQYR